MLTRRFILSGLVAAPAVIAADKLMPVRSIVKPYATVWGVGWNLEVIEYSIWTPADALGFAKFDGGPIDKFREVTEVVYANPLPLPFAVSDHWTKRRLQGIGYFETEAEKAGNFDRLATYVHDQHGEVGVCDGTTYIHKLNIPKDPMDNFAKMQRGEFKTVPCPTPEHSHAVRFEPVTVFDDPKELEGKHLYVRNWASNDMSKSAWEEAGIWV